MPLSVNYLIEINGLTIGKRPIDPAPLTIHAQIAVFGKQRAVPERSTVSNGLLM
jgi:hypothetical protein